MIGLLDALGRERAIWVGHDWGSPVVWNIASHHPDRCDAVANLCVPYHTLEYGLEACLPLVDRSDYPEDEFPAGQWEYQLFCYTCETVTSRLADPMRSYCSDLTETVIDSGHWMAQEKPREVNAALVHWIATRVTDCWPVS